MGFVIMVGFFRSLGRDVIAFYGNVYWFTVMTIQIRQIVFLTRRCAILLKLLKRLNAFQTIQIIMKFKRYVIFKLHNNLSSLDDGSGSSDCFKR